MNLVAYCTSQQCVQTYMLKTSKACQKYHDQIKESRSFMWTPTTDERKRMVALKKKLNALFMNKFIAGGVPKKMKLKSVFCIDCGSAVCWRKDISEPQT